MYTWTFHVFYFERDVWKWKTYHSLKLKKHITVNFLQVIHRFVRDITVNFLLFKAPKYHRGKATNWDPYSYPIYRIYHWREISYGEFCWSQDCHWWGNWNFQVNCLAALQCFWQFGNCLHNEKGGSYIMAAWRIGCISCRYAVTGSTVYLLP
jgi:hypothetical protein